MNETTLVAQYDSDLGKSTGSKELIVCEHPWNASHN